MSLKILKKPLIVAVVGKGGSGKSVIATLIAKVVINNYNYKLLLIDGDPTYPHFSKMMSITPKVSLETVRSNLIHDITSGNKSSKDAAEFIDFYVYNSLIETKQFNLFYIGQPEASGCFCPSNTIMKKAIESISRDFEIVLIDCEAGLEQINRMVIQTVDIIIIVTDGSQRSLNTAITIRKMAQKFTDYKRIGLIINRFKGDLENIMNKVRNLDFLVYTIIPEDEIISIYDSEGEPIINIPQDAESYIEIKKSLYKILSL